MNQQFASIELARLYESQGYLEDALVMYKTLDDEGERNEDSEIRAAITRLEASMDGLNKPASVPGDMDFEKMIVEVNGPVPGDAPESDQEAALEGYSQWEGAKTEQENRVSRLLEKWLMLLVTQRRVRAFKAIREKV